MPPPPAARDRPDPTASQQSCLRTTPGSRRSDVTRAHSKRSLSGAPSLTAEDTTHVEITLCWEGMVTHFTPSVVPWGGREELALSPGRPPSLWDRGSPKPQGCLAAGPWASLLGSHCYLYRGLSVPPPEETGKVWGTAHRSRARELFRGLGSWSILRGVGGVPQQHKGPRHI